MKKRTALLVAVSFGAIAAVSFPAIEERLSAPPAREPAPVRLLFVGDLFFDRTIRTAMEREGSGFPLSCAAPTLRGYDLVVGNLEGPITPYPSKSEGSVVGSPENYTFTFPTTTPAALASANVRLVALGNNHIMNMSRDGLEQTKAYLRAGGIGYFGDPDALEAQRVARMEIGGIPFSFVNWSDWTSDKTDHTVAQVREEARAERVVFVYAHWGEEYVPAPDRVRRLARSFIDAGAFAVFGSHPHVVLERETHDGKPIYYSLGNFLFDQYWDDAVSHGLAVEVVVSGERDVAVRELPTEMHRDGRVCFAD